MDLATAPPSGARRNAQDLFSTRASARGVRRAPDLGLEESTHGARNKEPSPLLPSLGAPRTPLDGRTSEIASVDASVAHTATSCTLRPRVAVVGPRLKQGGKWQDDERLCQKMRSRQQEGASACNLSDQAIMSSSMRARALAGMSASTWHACERLSHLLSTLWRNGVALERTLHSAAPQGMVGAWVASKD